MDQASPKKISLITRLSSMLLDHVATSVMMVIVIVPIIVITSFQDLSSSEPPQLLLSDPIFKYLFPLAFAIYFSKDSIDGRSVAKRMTKLRVINLATGESADPVRCCLRNLSIVIWPVEVFFTILSPSRRMGDWLAGTEVVAYEKIEQTPPVQWTKLGLALVLGYLFAFLFFYGMESYLIEAMQQH